MEYLLSKMMHDDASNVTKFGNYFANVTIARFSMNFFFFLVLRNLYFRVYKCYVTKMLNREEKRLEINVVQIFFLNVIKYNL